MKSVKDRLQSVSGPAEDDGSEADAEAEAEEDEAVTAVDEGLADLFRRKFHLRRPEDMFDLSTVKI